MLARLGGALAARGLAPTVVALARHGSLTPAVVRSGVPVIEIDVTSARRFGTGIVALAREFRRIRPDVVHTWLYKSDLVGLAAARLAGIQSVVWDIRCSVVDAAAHPSTRLLPLLARLSSVPSAVVANSTAGRLAHEAIGYAPRRWQVISNGIDVARFSPERGDRDRLARELPLHDATHVVVSIARFHRLKDHGTMLAAMPQVWRQLPKVHFVLAGPGVDPQNPFFASALASSAGRLHLLGTRSDPEFLLASADLSVLTSTSEGFPNVIAESMASGTPCVATAAGDAAHILGPTGTVVPVRNPAAVAHEIVQRLSEPPGSKHARAAAARQRIEQEFSLEGVTARYIELYERVRTAAPSALRESHGRTSARL